MRRNLMFLGLVMILFLSACNAKEDKPATQQPKTVGQEKVIIENYGRTTTYEKVPERAVSIELGPTQVLLALGLEDKIRSVALADFEYEDCLPEYRDKLSKLDVMIKGLPTLELLLSHQPDFVYGTIYALSGYGETPLTDVEKENIPVYCMTGTCSEKPSIGDVYTDIADLGKIFHKENEAAALIARYQEREKAIKSEYSGREVRIMGYDSGDKQAYVAGKGIESEIFRLAGGVNVYEDSNKAFLGVNWEDIAIKNPEVIVIHEYATEQVGTAEEKIKLFKEHPALKNVDAVKNDNFVVVTLAEVFPGLQVFDAAERIQAKIKSIAQ